ncbi:MAG: SH3 domain-containing protein [Caldilineaceae bacterium]|nr:SH3 domain-containing protein [Caldilineaceae bacterium]MDE0338247.1 SH3 domain-containing protein [Caldilineaceae bacterium]
MLIRLVLGFGALLFLAITQPGSLQSGQLGSKLAQSTPISPTVLAVVRNQGSTLYDRPNGEPQQDLVGGSLVTARLRSTDLLWVFVQTRDQTEGWVEVRTLLAAGLGRLPVETPTPELTSTPTITLTPTPSPSPSPTPEVMAVQETATSSPTPMGEATAMPEATVTPEAMEESTPQPTPEAMPEATTMADTPEPTPTPFQPPEGPVALSLARIGGAVLWDGEDGAFVAHFKAGSRLTAAFRTENGEWFYVYDDNGFHGWASAKELLVVSGHLLTVKEFTIPLDEIVPIEDEEMAPEDEPSDIAPAIPLEKVIVTVNSFGQRLNVRAGPGTEYDIVAKAVGGVTFNGIGRTEEGDWVKVAIADLPSGYGWVFAFYVTTTGPFEELPVEDEMMMEEEIEMDAEKEDEMEEQKEMESSG